MKKISLIALAALAVLSISCNKDTTMDQKNDISPKILTATTDDNVTTKTSLEGTSIIWTSTDVISAFDVDGQNHPSTKTEVSASGKDAQFEIGSLSVEDDVMMALYPYDEDATFDGNDFSIETTIPTVQHIVANSFANGANVAVAEGLASKLKFRNIGAFLCLSIANDNVQSVKLSSNSSMTGNVVVDYNDGEPELILDDTKVVNDYVELQGSFVKGEKYYFVVAPGEYEGLTITLTDDNNRVASFTNNNALSVSRNENLFIAALPEVPESKWNTNEPYIEFTNADISEMAGSYATGSITNSYGTWNYNACKQTNNTTKIAYIQIRKNATTSYIEIPKVKGTITKVEFTDVNNGSNQTYTGELYFRSECSNDATAYATASGATSANANLSMVVSEGFDHGYIMSSGACRFAGVRVYYDPNGVVPDKVDASWSVSPESISVEAGKTATAAIETNYDGTLSVSSTADEIATVSIEGKVITVTGIAEGSTTITVTGAATTQYNAISKIIDVNVSAPTITYTTIDKIFESGVGTYSVQNAVVMAKASGNVVIGDATANIMLYKNGNDLEVGQVITLLNQPVSKRNDLLQFDSPDYEVTDERVSPNYGTPVELLTDDAISSWEGDPQYQYIHVVGIMQTDNRTIKCGSKGIYIVNTPGYAGKMVDVYAYANGSESSYGTITSTLVSIAEVDATSYSVTVASGIVHGTVVANPTSAVAGAEVTLTITPDSQYKLGSLSVVDSDNNPITVTNNKFIMPDADVVVTASFVESGFVVVKFVYSELYADINTSNATKDLDGETDTVDGVSMTYVKVSGSNSPKYYYNGTNLRIYNESTITITAPAGKNIKEIAAIGTTTWANEKMSGDSGSVSDSNKKWTGSANVVVLTITGSFRFSEIDITVE